MDTQGIIEEFFKEQFKNTSRFFLYKDKQLLKQGKYKDFAKEQIGKARNIFWSVAFGVIMCSWYGVMSLIEYGSNPNLFDLAIGLGAWIGLILILVFATKEYYTIKSSMSLFMKLLGERSKE